MGDRPAEIWALINLAPQATELGDYDRAIACCEAGFALARAEGNPAAMVLALHKLAIIALQLGDPATASDQFEAALALAREHGVAWLVPINLVGLGFASVDLADHPRAAACLREGLELGKAGENIGDVIDAIEGLARLAAAIGQVEPAARLFGATAVIRDEIGRPLSPAEIGHFAPILDALQDDLGAEGFAATWAAGRTLSQDEAITEALAIRADVAATPLPGPGSPPDTHGLTAREMEVLCLIVAGHVNREVGEVLFISPTTVARHLANIYRKLGVNSRATLTAFALRHSLF
jgi:DNA-binding CsgD family transcriptional regulator